MIDISGETPHCSTSTVKLRSDVRDWFDMGQNEHEQVSELKKKRKKPHRCVPHHKALKIRDLILITSV